MGWCHNNDVRYMYRVFCFYTLPGSHMKYYTLPGEKYWLLDHEKIWIELVADILVVHQSEILKKMTKCHLLHIFVKFKGVFFKNLDCSLQERISISYAKICTKNSIDRAKSWIKWIFNVKNRPDFSGSEAFHFFTLEECHHGEKVSSWNGIPTFLVPCLFKWRFTLLHIRLKCCVSLLTSEIYWISNISMQPPFLRSNFVWVSFFMHCFLDQKPNKVLYSC